MVSFMQPKISDDEFSPEETARRRDAVIKHMLNTPPKPHSQMKVGKPKAKASQRGRPAKKRKGAGNRTGPKS
jgi:hypothetical protein